MTDLPVPITFKLPGDAWRAVNPSEVGVNAAFVAIRTTDDDSGYTPLITITGGVRPRSLTLAEVADESLNVLAAQAGEVELVQRSEQGNDTSSGITQLMGGVADIDGRRFDVRQGQAVVGYTLPEDDDQWAIYLYTVTCTYRQFDQVGREFQEFMASLKVGGPFDGDADVSG